MWRVTGLAAARNKDGRLALVATAGLHGSRDAVWYLPDLHAGGWSMLGDPPGGGGHAELLAGGAARPAVAANPDGRFEVAAMAPDAVTAALWHARETGDGGWSPWQPLQAPPGGDRVDEPPTLVQNQDGRLELFVVDRGSRVWHRSQEQAGGDRWGAWDPLEQPTSHGQPLGIEARPEVAQNQDGRLELFVQAGDGAVWHRWQLTAGGGWSGWSSLRSPGEHVAASGPPAAVRAKDGRLHLFVLGSDRAVWHLWQLTPGGGWSGWESLGREGTGFMELAPVARPDGPLVLCAVDDFTELATSDLWTREQGGPDSAWGPWISRRDDLLAAGGQEPWQIGNPTLALLREGDADAVVLFLSIEGQATLYRLVSPAPEFWAIAPMLLRPPPEAAAAARRERPV
jgi:hypothetical protein